MTTRSGTPYQQAQTSSGVAMEQHFETLVRTLNDQMAQLNQNLTDQLAQSNQTMTTQMNHITARLDRLETRNPCRTYETQTELEPKPEFSTPVNHRRVPCQAIFPEPNPRRPHQDPFCEPDDRRPDQGQIDRDDRTLRNI